ncbi:MAG: hypothetical protein IT289_00665 [Oligoflexia bacterium]|nr:hypothetical protein [Oligoflexia bacterium]
MSYRFEPLDTGRGIIRLEALDGGREHFQNALKAALQAIAVNLIIDLSLKPQAVSEILQDLMALQKVVSQHGGRLTVSGIRGQIPSDLIGRVETLGILVEDSKPTSTPDLSQSVILKGTSARESIAADAFETRASQLKARLAEVLRMARALESEKKFFDDRILLLKKEMPGVVNKESFGKVRELEVQLEKLTNESNLHDSKLNEMSQKRPQVEESWQNELKKKQDEFAKAKPALEKKLSELKKQKDKLLADFKRASDARKKEIEKLTSKKA